MRILILSQYFYPETNAPAHRWGLFSKFLAEENKVTVICEPPNYPRGVIFDGYKNKLLQKEHFGKVDILRAWVFITPKKDFLSRIINYFSFFISGIVASFFVGKVDIVLASSPPFPMLFAGYIISKIKGAKLVSEVRDIWPDSAVDVGMLKKNSFYALMEMIEKFVYKKSEKIIVNAEGIKKRLVEKKGVPLEKIEVIMNGADLDFFNNKVNYFEIDKKYELKDKCVVLYSGLIGLAQHPEVIVEAAKMLAEKKDIVFLIIGDGPLKDRCEKLVSSYGLENVIFTGERPRSEMPVFVSRANVALIPYKNSEIFKDVIPSKMFDYMAGSVPMIINLDGEGARAIQDANCGLVVKPEDPGSLKEGILKIYSDREVAKMMGMNGRKYAEENYDKKKIAAKLLEILNRIAN